MKNAPVRSITLDGVKVTVTRSAGRDDAYVVFVDTEFEPDETPGLRVIINDNDTYEGVPYLPESLYCWEDHDFDPDTGQCRHCPETVGEAGN